MFKKFVILVLLLGLTGCGRISVYKYKAHDIAAPTGENISILHVPREIYVQEIDGKGKYSPSGSSDLFPYSAAEIELIPGIRTLSLKYSSGRQYSINKSNITFNFAPGKKYFIQSKVQYAKKETGGLQASVSYRIDECGSTEEAAYNEAAKKADQWLAPYVPACGK